jgi:hypothetical protein
MGSEAGVSRQRLWSARRRGESTDPQRGMKPSAKFLSRHCGTKSACSELRHRSLAVQKTWAFDRYQLLTSSPNSFLKHVLTQTPGPATFGTFSLSDEHGSVAWALETVPPIESPGPAERPAAQSRARDRLQSFPSPERDPSPG